MLAEEASCPFLLTSYPIAAYPWRTAGIAVPNLRTWQTSKLQRNDATGYERYDTVVAAAFGTH